MNKYLMRLPCSLIKHIFFHSLSKNIHTFDTYMTCFSVICSEFVGHIADNCSMCYLTDMYICTLSISMVS